MVQNPWPCKAGGLPHSHCFDPFVSSTSLQRYEDWILDFQYLNIAAHAEISRSIRRYVCDGVWFFVSTTAVIHSHLVLEMELNLSGSVTLLIESPPLVIGFQVELSAAVYISCLSWYQNSVKRQLEVNSCEMFSNVSKFRGTNF